MRKKKGAALPTAIALCSILLIVTLGVTTAIFESVSAVRTNEYNISNHLYFEDNAQRFINNEDLDESRYDWVIKVKEDDNSIKALIAYTKGTDEIVFYCIYDFDDHKYLAYQDHDIYIKDNKLGGIIDLEVGE